MADRKISDLTALTAPASGDYLPIVDISEGAAASKNKRVTIQSLFQGIPVNVGIGTSSPSGLLTVYAATAGTAADFVIANPANLWSIKTGTTTNALTIVDTQFSAERLRIDTTGNVGIGTSSPTFVSGGGLVIYKVGDARITLKNNTTGDGSATGAGLVYSGVNLTVNNQEAGFTAFTTTGTERLRIDSSGRVGIGTINSVGKLTVATSSADPSAGLGSWSDGYLVIAPGGTTASGGVGLSFSTSSNVGGISCATPGSAWRDLIYKASAHRFELGGSEAARIDSSGRVGIGTTSPTTLLDVNADTVRVRTARTPASASATGATGEICWDASYIYVAVGTNTWKRTTLTSW